MATIQKRKNKNSTISYRVMIRTKDGMSTTYKTFPTLQEAKDWALQEEASRRQQIYFPERTKNKHTHGRIDRQLIHDRKWFAILRQDHHDWPFPGRDIDVEVGRPLEKVSGEKRHGCSPALWKAIQSFVIFTSVAATQLGEGSCSKR